MAGPLFAARREAGSAVAEFVMVAGLVLLLGVGVFQLGLALHVRNTLIMSASEGARWGARADAGPAQAVERTKAILVDSLPTAYGENVSATRESTNAGVAVIAVSVTAPMPVIGLLGPAGSITVTGRAFDEQQVAP